MGEGDAGLYGFARGWDAVSMSFQHLSDSIGTKRIILSVVPTVELYRQFN
jgi:hypothetical protein